MIMNKGFTLLEIIIVIFIILTTILAVAGLSWQNLSTINLNYSRLSAAYLAQEGMEIVRNTRDQNWLDEEDFNNDLGVGDYCCDINNRCVSSGDFDLNIDNDGYYVCSGGDPSRFSRKITISESSEGCFNVEAEVSWTERGRSYNIITNQDLCDWLN